MRIPDWLFYLVVFVLVVSQLLDRAPDSPPEGPFTPEPPPADAGAPLPPPSPMDEVVRVETGPGGRDGVGTAFAIAPGGVWMSARHVVDGCRAVGLVTGPDAAVEAEVTVSRQADVALLRTAGGPQPLALNLAAPLAIGQTAYHVGYPQGVPGEVQSRLMGRHRLVTTGRWRAQESVLVWAEVRRSGVAGGSLGGISGGPTFDAAGAIIGVTVAESDRRGRIYTAAPESLSALIARTGVRPQGRPAPQITAASLPRTADRLRADQQVIQVACFG